MYIEHPNPPKSKQLSPEAEMAPSTHAKHACKPFAELLQRPTATETTLLNQGTNQQNPQFGTTIH